MLNLLTLYFYLCLIIEYFKTISEFFLLTYEMEFSFLPRSKSFVQFTFNCSWILLTRHCAFKSRQWKLWNRLWPITWWQRIISLAQLFNNLSWGGTNTLRSHWLFFGPSCPVTWAWWGKRSWVINVSVMFLSCVSAGCNRCAVTWNPEWYDIKLNDFVKTEKLYMYEPNI